MAPLENIFAVSAGKSVITPFAEKHVGGVATREMIIAFLADEIHRCEARFHGRSEDAHKHLGAARLRRWLLPSQNIVTGIQKCDGLQ